MSQQNTQSIIKSSLYFEWLSYEENMETRLVAEAYWSNEKNKAVLYIIDPVFKGRGEYFYPMDKRSYFNVLYMLKTIQDEFNEISSREEFLKKLENPREEWDGFYFGIIVEE